MADPVLYDYAAGLVINAVTNEPQPGARGQLYVDGSETTRAQIFDRQGNPLDALVAGPNGFHPPFRSPVLVGVKSFGPGLSEAVLSVQAAGGIAQQALAAAAAAQSTADNALQLVQEAGTGGGTVGGATETYVDQQLAPVQQGLARSLTAGGSGAGFKVWSRTAAEGLPTAAQGAQDGQYALVGG